MNDICTGAKACLDDFFTAEKNVLHVWKQDEHNAFNDTLLLVIECDQHLYFCRLFTIGKHWQISIDGEALAANHPLYVR